MLNDKMESKRTSSEKKAVEAYLASHKVQEALNSAVNATLREKPEDPFLMISDLMLGSSLSANGVIDVVAHKTYTEDMQPNLRVTLSTRFGKASADVVQLGNEVSLDDGATEKGEEMEENEEEKAEQDVLEQNPGVDAAVQLVSGSVKSALIGADPVQAEEVDLLLQDLSLQYGSALPPPVSFAISATFSIAAAQIRKIPLCKQFCAMAMGESMALPVPAVTVLKAQQTEVWRSISVLPTGANSFRDAMAIALRIQKRVLACAEMSRGMNLIEACELVWDQGIVALDLQGKVKLGLTLDADRLVIKTDTEELVKTETKEEMEETVEGVEGQGVQYCLSSELTLSGDEIFDSLNELVTEKLTSNIASITNPFAQSEPEFFKKLQIAVGDSVCVYCTHICEGADEEKYQGGLILRTEDMKTVTELLEKRLVTLGNGLSTAFSMIHESFGDSSILAALSVGTSTGLVFIDTNINACRKIINEFLMLEDELDAQAFYVGGAFRECGNS